MSPRNKAAIWGFLTIVILAPILLWLGNAYEQILLQEERQHVSTEVAIHTSSLEKSFGRILAKLESLAAFVRAHRTRWEKISVEEFQTFAEGLHASAQWIRAFQIVTDGVISHTYPLKGNEPVLGYNLMADKRPVIGGDVLRALRTRAVTITGPIELVQGDLGIIIRNPLDSSQSSKGRLVAVVMNIHPLFIESGIDTEEVHSVRVAIREKGDQLFFGSQEVFDNEPVIETIHLPDGTWEIGAIPIGGWNSPIHQTLFFFYASGSLVVLLTGLLVFAVAHRQARLFRAVSERTKELSDANAELEQDIKARKEAEAALRASEENFRTLIEQASDGIFIADSHGRYIDVNSSACEMLGYSREELLRLRIPDIVAKASLASQPLRLEDLRKSKSLISERVLVRKDGTVLATESSSKSLPDGRIIAIVRDITERNNALARFHESEEQYRTLAETATDAIVTIDENSKILYMNAAIKNVFGYAREELIGKQLTILMPEYLRMVHEAALDRYVRTGKRHLSWDNIELKGLHKNGNEIPLEVSFAEFRKESHYLFTGIIRDITERRKAEQALQENEKHYRELMAQSPVGVQVFAPDGTLVQVNRAWENIWGVPAEKAVGQHNPLYDRQIEQLGIREKIEQVFKGGIVEFEDIFYDPSASGMPGAKRWIRPKAYQVRDERGHVLHIVVMSEDITTQKEAQKRILQINEELERRVKERTVELETSNKELEAFSYSVSHDLRAPLRGIHGFASILLADYGKHLDSEAKRVIKVIKANTSRMGTLIDELLTFSRLSRTGLTHEPIDMSSLVADCIRELIDLGDYPNTNISVEQLPTLTCDKIMMRQVWTNLLSNAAKFSSTQPEPQIEIGSSTADGEVIFFVKDNGVGFEMQYVNQLFGVFHRLHREDEFSGTGVGLAIVKRIVERHGGRVWAESQEGEGAEFFFSMPHSERLGTSA